MPGWKTTVTPGEGYPADIEETLGTTNRYGDPEAKDRLVALQAVIGDDPGTIGDFVNSDIGAAAGDILLGDSSPETQAQVKTMYEHWKGAYDQAGLLEGGIEEVDRSRGKTREWKRGGGSQWKK